jgi:hypothetical protein
MRIIREGSFNRIIIKQNYGYATQMRIPQHSRLGLHTLIHSCPYWVHVPASNLRSSCGLIRLGESEFDSHTIPSNLL